MVLLFKRRTFLFIYVPPFSKTNKKVIVGNANVIANALRNEFTSVNRIQVMLVLNILNFIQTSNL